jgi:EAL domain-containing protein (putative c-di-GMP-specific phosphodiesterase class I)/GGDEF domain-containing protein
MPDTASPRAAAAADEPTLAEILRDGLLTPNFQPIVSFRQRAVFGYESLIRGPEGTALHSPLALFEAAGHTHQVPELDVACREAAVRAFGRLGLRGKLFINVDPNVLLREGLDRERILALLSETGMRARDLVIEVTERTPVDDYEGLAHILRLYREMGLGIAIDDFGVGYSGLRHWYEVRPHYVKIDRHFVSNVHQDPDKLKFLHAIREIARSLDCQVVAEGLESRAEADTVRRAGVVLGQGFHFALPAPEPVAEVEAEDLEMEARSGERWHLTERVISLARPRPSVSPHQTVEDIAEIFLQEPELPSVAVVERERPVGLVRRSELMQRLFSRYGRDLYGRKPISRFMDRKPLVAESHSSVEALSKRITNREGDPSVDGDFIIVNQDGGYVGVASVLDLLGKITDLQIRNARYANPLTQLPGNVPINEHLDALLSARECFVAVYSDLDNFKPFNDVYGYARGDDVLRFAGELLSAEAGPEDFIGHVGGDDFIAVMVSPDWLTRCRRVLDRFAAEIPAFYNPDDRAAGGLAAVDRKGRHSWFPMLGLSLGAVPGDPGRFHSHYQVADTASEVKKMAKEVTGSALFVDRRQEGECYPPGPGMEGGAGLEYRVGGGG